VKLVKRGNTSTVCKSTICKSTVCKSTVYKPSVYKSTVCKSSVRKSAVRLLRGEGCITAGTRTPEMQCTCCMTQPRRGLTAAECDRGRISIHFDTSTSSVSGNGVRDTRCREMVRGKAIRCKAQPRRGKTYLTQGTALGCGRPTDLKP
jgi:hypothetical protein